MTKCGGEVAHLCLFVKKLVQLKSQEIIASKGLRSDQNRRVIRDSFEVANNDLFNWCPGVILAYMGDTEQASNPDFSSKLQEKEGVIYETDDHKKPPISFYDFLWSSLCIYV